MARSSGRKSTTKTKAKTRSKVKKSAGTTRAAKQPAALFDPKEMQRARRARRPLPDKPQLRHDRLKMDLRSGFRAEPSLGEMSRLRQAALVQARRVSAIPGTQGAAQPVAPVVGGNNWTPLGPLAIPNGQTYGGARVLVSGRVTAIAIDPAAPHPIYIGTAMGGVWRSDNAGASWRPLTDNEASLAIGALTLDPGNSQIVYAGTGEGNFSLDSYYGAGILRSTDGGATWMLQAAATFSGGRFNRIAVTPGTPARIFAATTLGLQRSTDSGATWTRLGSGLPAVGFCTDVVIDPTTPTTVYAAFWGNGIYKSTNAGAATPTFTHLTTGLPNAAAASPNGITRVSLAISASSPQTLYALMANNDFVVDKLYMTSNGGANWSQIALPGGAGTGIGGQGFYNLQITVDPTTPDIIYFGGIELWKGVRAAGGTWTVTKIGGGIHPDHHFVAVDPTNHLTIYAGSDGGIYRSTDGGGTWDDSINKGLSVMQYEFIDDHPSVAAVVLGGTQDNGTEQYRNSPVFHHADDGDGGFAIISDGNPNQVLSTYYGPSPKRSTLGGKYGSWTSVAAGIASTSGQSLFYPPMAACGTDPNRLAFGTDQINLDGAQGTGGWPTKVLLPGITGNVSAIAYVDVGLIYVGTDTGQVYKLTGSPLAATLISQAPLPGRYIWDVSPLPGATGTVIAVMNGFGGGHVFRGVVPATGAATWTDISGTGAGALPDIPVNALVIDPGVATTMYIGTDIGVFRTTDGGANWALFSDGLPNCAVYDLRLFQPQRLLRAALHGRGLWEKQVDLPSTPAVDLFLRDHLMDSARVFPTPSNIPSAVEDPLRFVALGDPQFWWMCADAKIDALEGTPLAYQMPVTAVDYVAFEARLQHRNPQRGRVNRVYVQVHNRGYQTATAVRVKILYADASMGLPNLPADFWTQFPADSADTSHWHPIGATQTLAAVPTLQPTVLEWDWTPPAGTAEHSCLLVVMDSASDPIPAANKVFDIGQLVTMEKRVGLKNLHVIDAPAAASGPVAGFLRWYAAGERAPSMRLVPHGPRGPKLGLIFSRASLAKVEKLDGLRKAPVSAVLRRRLSAQFGDRLKGFDLQAQYLVADQRRGVAVERLAGRSGEVLLLMTVPKKGHVDGLSVVQTEGKRVVGGSTYVFRTGRR